MQYDVKYMHYWVFEKYEASLQESIDPETVNIIKSNKQQIVRTHKIIQQEKNLKLETQKKLLTNRHNRLIGKCFNKKCNELLYEKRISKFETEINARNYKGALYCNNCYMRMKYQKTINDVYN